MNWLIVVPLVASTIAVAILTARGRFRMGGRPQRPQLVVAVMTGVATGGIVIALNYDLVPDDVEIAAGLVFACIAVVALVLLAFELARG